MTDARRGARANGADTLKAVSAAATAQAPAPSPLVLPPEAVQKTRFPYIEHFAARAQLTLDAQMPKAWELSLGFRIGIKPGRQIVVSFTPGTPGRAMAQMFRSLAQRIDELADDCERAPEGPAQEGADLAPDPAAAAVAGAFAADDANQRLARISAKRSALACATCGERYGDPHKADCTMAASTCPTCGVTPGEDCARPDSAACPQRMDSARSPLANGQG